MEMDSSWSFHLILRAALIISWLNTINSAEQNLQQTSPWSFLESSHLIIHHYHHHHCHQVQLGKLLRKMPRVSLQLLVLPSAPANSMMNLLFTIHSRKLLSKLSLNPHPHPHHYPEWPTQHQKGREASSKRSNQRFHGENIHWNNNNNFDDLKRFLFVCLFVL